MIFMNKALNGKQFIKLEKRFTPYKDGVMRITRNFFKTPADLIAKQQNIGL